MFVMSVVCCQVEVSVTSWSLVQRSPTDCGASLCGLETSRMRRPWPTLGRSATAKKILHLYRRRYKTVGTIYIMSIEHTRWFKYDRNWFSLKP
jgi:hypothetical protein